MLLSFPSYTKSTPSGPRSRQESGWDSCGEFSVMGSRRPCIQQSLQKQLPKLLLCHAGVMARSRREGWGSCFTVKGLRDPDQADRMCQSSSANSLDSCGDITTESSKGGGPFFINPQGQVHLIIRYHFREKQRGLGDYKGLSNVLHWTTSQIGIKH